MPFNVCETAPAAISIPVVSLAGGTYLRESRYIPGRNVSTAALQVPTDVGRQAWDRSELVKVLSSVIKIMSKSGPGSTL